MKEQSRNHVFYIPGAGREKEGLVASPVVRCCCVCPLHSDYRIPWLSFCWPSITAWLPVPPAFIHVPLK